MNSKRCNEAPYCCAAICISVIYRRLLQKLLPSELLEVFFFSNCLMLIISLWRSRLQWNHAKPQKWQSLNYMGARLLLNCQECPLTELFCYSCLLRLRKNMRLASKLSFFCYLNIEIERKKEEKFDSLLTLALINLEFHTHSLKSCHGVSKLAGGSELISPTGFHMTSLKFKLKTVDPTESLLSRCIRAAEN